MQNRSRSSIVKHSGIKYSYKTDCLVFKRRGVENSQGSKMSRHEPSWMEYGNEELEGERMTGSGDGTGERRGTLEEAGEGEMQEIVMTNNSLHR